MQNRYKKAKDNSGKAKKSLPQKRQAHQRHKKSKIIGAAIIFVFLFVPLLFILLYLNSGQLQEDDTHAISQNNSVESDVGIDYGDTQNGDVLGASEADIGESSMPLVEIIGTAYLTFDDGPDRAITPGILDILMEEEIKATFFVLPNEGVEDIFRRIIDEGHEIGNHSFSHRYDILYESSNAAFKEDLLKSRSFIYNNFGYTTTSFRFPGGSMSWPGVLRSRLDVINELGYRHYDWLVDSEDWRKGRNQDDIIREVLDQTKNLGREHIIVLMHDYRNSHETLEALPGVIKGLRELGYEFDIVRNYPTDLRTGFGSNS